MRRHLDRFLQCLFKGRHNTMIKCRSTLKKYLFSYPFITNNPVEVIRNDWIRQAAYYIISVCTLLLVMDNIRLNKNCTAFPHFHRPFWTKCKVAKLLLNRDSNPFRLLFEEWACPCSTCFVHLKIHYDPIIYTDVLGILAAYFKNGIDLSVKVNCCFSLGRDFISHNVSTYKISSKVAAWTGCSGSNNLNHVSNFVSDFSKTSLDSFKGSAFGHKVSFCN